MTPARKLTYTALTHTLLTIIFGLIFLWANALTDMSTEVGGAAATTFIGNIVITVILHCVAVTWRDKEERERHRKGHW